MSERRARGEERKKARGGKRENRREGAGEMGVSEKEGKEGK